MYDHDRIGILIDQFCILRAEMDATKMIVSVLLSRADVLSPGLISEMRRVAQQMPQFSTANDDCEATARGCAAYFEYLRDAEAAADAERARVLSLQH